MDLGNTGSVFITELPGLEHLAKIAAVHKRKSYFTDGGSVA